MLSQTYQEKYNIRR